MKNLKFKTTINCAGCVATITPILNALPGIEKWEVNTIDPQKILTIETSGLSAEDIQAVLATSGFKSEEIK